MASINRHRDPFRIKDLFTNYEKLLVNMQKLLVVGEF